MILPAPRFCRCIRWATTVFLIAAPGCREIPPRIPPDFIGSPAAPGWPPLAVHDLDPFDPKNRWFHRAFGSRSPGGDIVAPHADEPCSFSTPSRVDAAELTALLERILASPAAGGAVAIRERVADAIFRSDALAEASRLHAAPLADGLAVREVVPFLLRLAAGDALPPLDPEAARALEPPPLRAGEWVEAAPPETPGLLPSPFDLRWTRAFVLRGRSDGDRSHAVLVRFRVAIDRQGAPLLLPIASECWELEEGEGEAMASAWRFDRAEWLAGRDPWRQLPEEAEITIRDPSNPSKLITGKVVSLAARFGGQGLRTDAPGARGEGAQLEAVARVLQGVLALRGAGP